MVREGNHCASQLRLQPCHCLPLQLFRIYGTDGHGVQALTHLQLVIERSGVICVWKLVLLPAPAVERMTELVVQRNDPVHACQAWLLLGALGLACLRAGRPLRAPLPLQIELQGARVPIGLLLDGEARAWHAHAGPIVAQRLTC